MAAITLPLSRLVSAEVEASTSPARYCLRAVTFAARSRSRFRLRVTSSAPALRISTSASIRPKAPSSFFVRLMFVLLARSHFEREGDRRQHLHRFGVLGERRELPLFQRLRASPGQHRVATHDSDFLHFPVFADQGFQFDYALHLELPGNRRVIRLNLGRRGLQGFSPRDLLNRLLGETETNRQHSEQRQAADGFPLAHHSTSQEHASKFLYRTISPKV